MGASDPLQTVTSTPVDAGLVAAVRQLHDALERVDMAAALRLKIARSDLQCLHLLAAGPATPRRIGAGLGLTSGSVTALLDRLEARGMVRRRPDPGDRRGVLVESTQAAAAGLAEAYGPLHEAMSRLVGRYGPERGAAAAKQLSDLARLCDWATRQRGGGAG